MNNSSVFNETQKIVNVVNPAIYGWQIVSGLTMLSINGLCFVSIIKHDILRKRKGYILMATLNLMEVIWAFGSIVAGCDRLYLHFSNKMTIKLTRWQCFLKPQSILSLMGLSSHGVGHLSIVADRVLSITWPKKHQNLDWRYAAAMVVFSFTVDIYLLPYLIYQMSKFADTNPSVSGYCSMMSIIPHQLPVWWASRKFNNGAMFLSVLLSLYIIARLGCFGLRNGQDENLSAIAKEQCSRQRRLAISVALSSVIRAAMTVLPGRNLQIALLSLGVKLGGIPNLIKNYFLVTFMIELGTVADFFVFTCRHIEMRMAIKYLFQGKRLTKRDIVQEKEKKNDVVEANELVEMANLDGRTMGNNGKEQQKIHPKKQQRNKETSTSGNEMPLHRKRIRGQRLSKIVGVIEL